jgi:hypothetical protein
MLTELYPWRPAISTVELKNQQRYGFLIMDYQVVTILENISLIIRIKSKQVRSNISGQDIQRVNAPAGFRGRQAKNSTRLRRAGGLSGES